VCSAFRNKPALLKTLVDVRAAASADPKIAELWTDLKQQRLTGATRIAADLAEAGLLRDGLSVDRARDLIWLYIAPVVDGLLVERGWTIEQRERWLADTSTTPSSPAHRHDRAPGPVTTTSATPLRGSRRQTCSAIPSPRPS
jgi:hypothetical protein